MDTPPLTPLLVAVAKIDEPETGGFTDKVAGRRWSSQSYLLLPKLPEPDA